MPSAFIGGFDLVSLLDDGEGTLDYLDAVTLKARFYDGAYIDDLPPSDDNGFVDFFEISGVSPGDLIEIYHDTYTGTCRQVACLTDDECAITNKIGTFIVDNNVTDTTEPEAVDIYIKDGDMDPIYVGSGIPGTTVYVPYESGYFKTLKGYLVPRDTSSRVGSHDFKALAEYSLTEFSTIPEGAGLVIGAPIDGGTALRFLISGLDLAETPTIGALQSARVNAAGTAFEAFNPITNSIVGASDIVQFKIKGHSTQTSNIFEIQKSSTTSPLFAINNSGSAYFRSRVSGNDSRIDFDVSSANPVLTIAGDVTNGYYPQLDFRIAGNVLVGTILGTSGGLSFSPGSGYSILASSNYTSSTPFGVKASTVGIFSVPLFKATSYQGIDSLAFWQDGRIEQIGATASYNKPLPVPVLTGASAGGIGGTLATNTYYYKITACNFAGETIGSNELSVAVTLGQNVTLTWTGVAGADHFRIYRSTTSGTYGASSRIDGGLYTTGTGVPYYIASFVDSGYAASAGTPPTSITHDIMTYRRWKGGSGKFIDFEDETGATLSSIDSNGKFQLALGSGGAFASLGGKLFQRVTSETTAGTSQENLYTYTLPAGSLLNDGDTIKCEYGGIFTGNANTKRIYPKFAGTVLATGQTASAGATDWTVDFYIIRVSNTVVRFVVEFTTTGDSPNIESDEITGLNLTTTAYDIDLDGRSVSAAGELTAHSGFGLFYPGV